MSFFSDNIDNNLIGDRVRDRINDMNNVAEHNNYTISDKITNILNIIYTDYIQHNKTVTVIVLVVIIFLIYRYCKKLDREGFEKSNNRLIKEISNQTLKLKHNEQPSFNPSKPVVIQQEYVNYIPEPIYIDIHDKGLVDGRKLYPYAKPFQSMNVSEDYPDVHKKTRNYYKGTENTYLGMQDTLIQHPYDWPTNIVSSTGDFVGYMANTNNKTLQNYQNSINDTNNTLFNNLQGPQHLDINNPELDMEPPYSTEIL